MPIKILDIKKADEPAIDLLLELPNCIPAIAAMVSDIISINQDVMTRPLLKTIAVNKKPKNMKLTPLKLKVPFISLDLIIDAKNLSTVIEILLL